jgi:Ca2+-binding RTX toxin-like protein
MITAGRLNYMAKRLLILTLLACVVCVMPAGAATVSQSVGPAFRDDGDIDGCGRYQQCGTKRTVVVTALPGERNSLTAELADPNSAFGDLIVRDIAGGPLSPEPGSNCALTAPSEVTCAAPPPPIYFQDGPRLADARFLLGDEDDSARAGTLPITAYGGPGADTLTAASSGSVLYGDDGLDTLHGGAGDDYLYGGSGRDHIYGGDGDDFITAGAGDDAVFGQLGDDDESGNGGRDLIDGGSGRDRLVGGSGRDVLLGRAGIDFLYARDRARDRVRCGSGRGRDRVSADDKDTLSGCEIRLR